MKRMRTVAVVFILSLSVYLAGCSNRFFDPTQIGRFRPVPAVNIILDSLGVAEETPSAWVGAEEPRPIDVLIVETDYVFDGGDIVRVSIFELQTEAIQYTNEFVVTESGKLSIPEVGVVQAAGLTESQLEEEIRQILAPGILKDPLVTVTLLRSQKRIFSILGDGVPRPSRYDIPRYDFRLTDALATAGGVNQFNVSYVYVSRSPVDRELIIEPVEELRKRDERRPEIRPPVTEPPELIDPEREMLEIIAPRAKRPSVENRYIIASAEMITDTELAEAALPEGFELTPHAIKNTPRSEPSSNGKHRQIGAEDMPETSAESIRRQTTDELINQAGKGRIEWIFQNGRWVPVQVGRPEPAVKKVEPEKLAPRLKEKVPEDFDWDRMAPAEVQTRVIKIPVDKLLGGDPRYNIVIRASDSIHVPVDIIGEFFIVGNVNGQGIVNLTGRPMTLKMAIAAAGGLGPLAWPKRCEVIRRIGENKEEIVMVDLDKISRGEQPDFFIKPNDLVNVGTHPTARWRAVLRNAFRATYGFGFIYDRNFGDRDFGTRRPIPHWF